MEWGWGNGVVVMWSGECDRRDRMGGGMGGRGRGDVRHNSAYAKGDETTKQAADKKTSIGPEDSHQTQKTSIRHKRQASVTEAKHQTHKASDQTQKTRIRHKRLA